MYNFKYVSVDLGNGSDFGGEWMYMLSDKKGTVVNRWSLLIEDEEDEKAARYFGWSEEEIKQLKDICK